MDELMSIIIGYQNILVALDRHQILYETAEKDREYYQQQMEASAPHELTGMNMSGEPNGNFSPLPLSEAKAGVDRAESQMYLEQCNIDRLKKEKQAIEDNINKLSGLEYKVAFKRIFERNKDGSHKTLEQIAGELNYSTSKIFKISANLSKKIDIKSIRNELEIQ